MRYHLTPRDRTVLIYVLWPAMLFAAAVWLVSPQAHALALHRGALDSKRVELQRMQADLARRSEVAGQLARLGAETEQLRRWILTKDGSVDAVVALQRRLQETGHAVQTIRVGEVDRPKVEERGPQALASITLEASATGSYHSLMMLLQQWRVDTIPLKLTRLEAATDESGEVRVKFLARALLKVDAQERRP